MDTFLIENEDEFQTSLFLPHLTGDAKGGMAKAKALAREAGLIEPDREPPGLDKLTAWFKRSCTPLLERCEQRWVEEDASQELKDQENYYDSRAARFRFNRQIGHVRRDHNDHGAGVYEWTAFGKYYRSWLGNQPLATPRQIAGMLIGRYPDRDVVVLHEGWTTTNCGGAAIIGGIGVPRYRAHLCRKLPTVLLTAERLYLDHGRILDMETAKETEEDLQAGRISRELYADTIAKLCREAPLDPDWLPPSWEELDSKGNIVPFHEDDTRDAPSDRSSEVVHYHLAEAGVDDLGNPVTRKRIHRSLVGAYEWEEAERSSDMDNGTDVQVLLGLSTQQIEETFELVGEEASIREFFANLAPRAASAEKRERLLNREPEQTVQF